MNPMKGFNMAAIHNSFDPMTFEGAL